MPRKRASRVSVAEENARIERAIARMLADGTIMSDEAWAESRRVHVSSPSSLTGFYHPEPGGQRRAGSPSPTAAAVAQYHGAGAKKPWSRSE